MRLRCIGTLPQGLEERLYEAGHQLAPPGVEPDLVIVGWDDGAEAVLADLASDDRFALVLGAGDDAPTALRAGATDVLAARSIEALLERIAVVERYAALWRRRERTVEHEARSALDDVSATRELLERLIDATPNPVMAADLAGRVIVFNRVAEAALGYTAAYAREHMHVSDIYANPADARRILARIRESGEGLATGLEVRLRARSGEHIPVVLSAGEVVDATGRLIATVGVFQDLREIIALRSRLEQTTEQLIATEKRAATVEVAGAAAHELNQPLTALMGTLELIEDHPGVPAEVRARLDKAAGQVERMADIVRALARTSRPRTTGYVGDARILELGRTESD